MAPPAFLSADQNKSQLLAHQAKVDLITNLQSHSLTFHVQGYTHIYIGPAKGYLFLIWEHNLFVSQYFSTYSVSPPVPPGSRFCLLFDCSALTRGGACCAHKTTLPCPLPLTFMLPLLLLTEPASCLFPLLFS